MRATIETGRLWRLGGGSANVPCWHKPESAESSAIRSLPGENQTFSNPGSTLQSGNSPNSLGAAVSSPHQASDCPAQRVPAGRFGPLHLAPGDFGCFLIQKL